MERFGLQFHQWSHDDGRKYPPGPKLRTPSHITLAFDGRIPHLSNSS